MRYQARWSNGYWKTFDRVLFTDIAVHLTQKDAEVMAKRANRGLV
jgi:hypothetical protein